MSTDEQERRAQASHHRIQQVAHSVWEARRQAITLLNRENAADLPREPKADLHGVVYEYLNVLRPYLVHHTRADDGNERIAELWLQEGAVPTGPVQVPVLLCNQCEEWDAVKAQTEVSRADECPECGRVGLDETTVNHPHQIEKIPLQQAQNLFLDATTRTEQVGSYDKRTETITETTMPPAGVLIHMSRLLDEAARELGFLPEGAAAQSGLPAIRGFNSQDQDGQGLENVDGDTTPDL